MHLSLLLAFTAAVAVAAPVFNPTPSGDMSGLPGDVIGWGFTITNDTDTIEITGAQFCLDPVAFPACTDPTTGSFADFISAYNDIIVGPGGMASQDFDPVLHTGVGSFTIDMGAIIGDMDQGQLVLTYNVLDVNGDVKDSGAMLAEASVTVGVPEPGSLVLLGVGLIGILAMARRKIRI